MAAVRCDEPLGCGYTSFVRETRTSEPRERCEVGFGLTLLETGAEHHNALPIPAWGFGIIAFALLFILMFVTYSIGKGRPHS